MEENKILFSVANDADGSAVRLDTKGSDELFAVALGIYQVINQCPDLCFMLSTIITMSKDEDFKRELDKHAVDVPDFNELLKNIK